MIFIYRSLSRVAVLLSFPHNCTQKQTCTFSILSADTHTYLSLLSMAIAQMFLQRRSRPRVACWMDSQSVSVAQASQSCSNTSHRFSTDATPVLCFSMSLCRSCTEKIHIHMKTWWKAEHVCLKCCQLPSCPFWRILHQFIRKKSLWSCTNHIHSYSTGLTKFNGPPPPNVSVMVNRAKAV